jgi:hypothetical protein
MNTGSAGLAGQIALDDGCAITARVYANFVGADAFPLVSALIWLCRHIQIEICWLLTAIRICTGGHEVGPRGHHRQ